MKYEKNKVIRTERGWGGHFIGSLNCLFRRNTLLEYEDKKIVVSTVGAWKLNQESDCIEIGSNRYYETMAFFAKDDEYNDADINNEVYFESNCGLDKLDDIAANNMHEAVVAELMYKLNNGNDWYCCSAEYGNHDKGCINYKK